MKSNKPAPRKKAAASRPTRSASRNAKSSASSPQEETKSETRAVRKPVARKPRAAKSAPADAKTTVRAPRRKSAISAQEGGSVSASPKPVRRRVPRPRVPRSVTRRKTPVEVASAPVPSIPSPASVVVPEPKRIPPILLEDDRPATAGSSGPGLRYALGPTPPARPLVPEVELPESYGTRKLLLAARDPHWLYAHWDLSLDEQRRLNSLSVDRHLILRVFVDTVGGRPFTEVHLHPESRHWFVHVGRGATQFVCELGYYAKDGNWVSVSVSSPTLTPPDSISQDTQAEFVTLPYELPLSKVAALVKEAARNNPPLARAIEELRAHGHSGLPEPGTPATPPRWTPAQEQALAEILSMDRVRRVWMGSLEITELIRREYAQELASLAAAEAVAPTSPSAAPGAVSSPMGAAWGAGGFWFNVNAELIIYGATEPDASVTIGGRPIRLRADGSFSYRFSLPDGDYELPVVAVSADRTDGRGAELQFSRRTDYHGDVGAQAQDPGLKSPSPENA